MYTQNYYAAQTVFQTGDLLQYGVTGMKWGKHTYVDVSKEKSIAKSLNKTYNKAHKNYSKSSEKLRDATIAYNAYSSRYKKAVAKNKSEKKVNKLKTKLDKSTEKYNNAKKINDMNHAEKLKAWNAIATNPNVNFRTVYKTNWVGLNVTRSSTGVKARAKDSYLGQRKPYTDTTKKLYPNRRTSYYYIVV